jgi:hypothetical protein
MSSRAFTSYYPHQVLSQSYPPARFPTEAGLSFPTLFELSGTAAMPTLETQPRHVGRNAYQNL